MAVEKNDAIRSIQSRLIAAGLLNPTPGADGIWGPASEGAFQKLLDKAGVTTEHEYSIAWSAKVSADFVEKVKKIAAMLRMPSDTGPSDLMACMAWESAETFSPDIKNAAGSGAVGLIQFMPKTAIGLGTTVEALAKLTAVQQLDYVYKYFEPYAGRLKNLGDLYMAILWPAGIGKSDDWVLWDKASRPTTFRQNAGLDVNKDDAITRAECVFKVRQKLNKGMQLEYRTKLS